MSVTHTFEVLPESDQMRLDIFLASVGVTSRNQAQEWIRQGWVSINGVVQSKVATRVKTGSKIVCVVSLQDTIEDAKGVEVEYDISQLHINVLYECDDYLVVDKPAGLLVHPTQASEPITLASWLQHTYPDIITVGDSSVRPGIVHRLDKDASGLLVVARTQAMFEYLKHQFQSRTVEKYYTVLVYGIIEADHGVIDFPIDRGKDGRMVSRPMPGELSLASISHEQPGKNALTEFDVVKRFTRYTLLRVRIHTGRMHQIRVHLYAYDHPVVGDVLYTHRRHTKRNDDIPHRIFLHATQLCFNTLQQEHVCYEDPIPTEMDTFITSLV